MIHVSFILYFVAFWAPPLKYRKSPDYVLVLELLNSEEKDVDSQEIETAPYNGKEEAGNVMQKEFNHKSNNQGVIIFKLPLEKLLKDDIKCIRVKVINSDYDQSQVSNCVSVFSNRNELLS